MATKITLTLIFRLICPPECSVLGTQGLVAVKSVPAQQTWGKYAAALLKFCLPASDSKPQQLGIIFDSYSTATMKELTKHRRGTPGRRTLITSSEQDMPKGKDWDSFL